LLAFTQGQHPAEVLTRIQGSAALAWITQDQGDTLHLARVSNSPLWIGQTLLVRLSMVQPRRQSRTQASCSVQTLTGHTQQMKASTSRLRTERLLNTKSSSLTALPSCTHPTGVTTHQPNMRMNGVSTQVITTHTYSKIRIACPSITDKDSPCFGRGFLFAWNLGLTYCLNIGRGVSDGDKSLFKQIKSSPPRSPPDAVMFKQLALRTCDC
jgi:hypothetical protein